MGSTVRKRCGDQWWSSLTYCTFEIIDMNLSSDYPRYHTKPQVAVVQSTHTHMWTHFRWIYQAALQNLGPLQGYCDTVGEDEGQHHIVKQLMGYDGLTHLSEPGAGEEKSEMRTRR